MANENQNPCCKCTTPEYSIYLNTQGPPGKQGEQGFPGYSPVITVDVQTDTTYKLNITDANGTITTPNLQGRGVPRGGAAGSVLTKTGDADFDCTWQDAYENMPLATATTPGIVQPDNVTTTVSGGVISAHLAVNWADPLKVSYEYYSVPPFLTIDKGIVAGNNLMEGTYFYPFAINTTKDTPSSTTPLSWGAHLTSDKTAMSVNPSNGVSYMVVRDINSGESVHTPLTMADNSQPYAACIVWGNYNAAANVFTPRFAYIPNVSTSYKNNGTEIYRRVNSNALYSIAGDLTNTASYTLVHGDIKNTAGVYTHNSIKLNSLDEQSVEFILSGPGQEDIHVEVDASFASLNLNAIMMNFPANAGIEPGQPIINLSRAVDASELYITNNIGETIWEVNYSTANTTVSFDIGNGLKLDDEGKLIANIDNDTITFNSAGQMVAQGGGGGSAPSNMVTTDTAQTISGAKTFTGNIILNGGQILAGTNAIINGTNTSLGIGNTNLPLTLYGSTIQDEDNHPILSAGNLADYLVAGTNISLSTGSDGKVTINSTGGGTGGTTDYTQLSNKPQVNNVELSGNKTLAELGIQPDTGFKFWSGTQTEYDGLATKDNNTLYFITGT